MIIRSLLLRHGRIALPRTTPVRPKQLRRFYASEIEETYSNPFEDQQYVAGAIGGSKNQAIANLPPRNDIEIQDPEHPVAQDWAYKQHSKAVTNHIGSAIAPHYRPHELLSYPPGPRDITLELLLASQSHLGHHTSLWNPANARYIFGIRKQANNDPIHIISLDVTAAHLRRAAKIVQGVTSRGGLVLFVGTREGQARAVVKAAQLAGGCHLFDHWIPGSVTNGQQILGRCAKKVVDENDQEVEGFEEQLLRKAALKPDLVVCLNPLENYVLLHECGLNNIPTIGIIDTDANPTWVTYPIPANDDSLRCVQVIAGVLGNAGKEGQQQRRAAASRGVVGYQQAHGLEAPKQEAKKGSRSRDIATTQAGSDEAMDEVEGFTLADLIKQETEPARGIEEDGVNANTSGDETLDEDLDAMDLASEDLEGAEGVSAENVKEGLERGKGNEAYRDQSDQVLEPSVDTPVIRSLESLEEDMGDSKGFEDMSEKQGRAGGNEVDGQQEGSKGRS